MMPSLVNFDWQPIFHNFSAYPLSDIAAPDSADMALRDLRLNCLRFEAFPFNLSGEFLLRNQNKLRISVHGHHAPLLMLGILPFGVWEEMPKNPLRCVVSRVITHVRTDWGPGLDLYHEVLECGHPYEIFPLVPEQFTAKRRRCAACGSMATQAAFEISLPPKKSPISISAGKHKERA